MKFILNKIGLKSETFEAQVLKIDKEFHTLVGLSRRIPTSFLEHLDIEEACNLKLAVQDRVMDLWNKNHHILKSDSSLQMVGTETLLQVLEC